MAKISYDSVSRFIEAKIPKDIEDEMLLAYSTCTDNQDDLTISDVSRFFKELHLPEEWYKLVDKQRICIDGTEVVDFEKLLSVTYRLLTFMDNERVIDDQWSLIVSYAGRLDRFPNTELRKQVLSLKDLQRCSSQLSMEPQQTLEMLACATEGRKVYITYLDFAYLLGKLGYLRY
ncbi:HFL210Cp [Eremothecium sinecaudum]|uniref:HFL210Cp n=1 Tax=Eremothecium sinecaudum TaxID=45286 RepID=A0A109UZQ5_9SACH|nr:HFL210Cp [Eremothecium sinecaudum]AMD21646.1 HFL210Cp [Eremothecium sinecaudum]